MANLLFLCDTYPPNVGGSETVMENLARGCVAKGHAVVVLAPSSIAPAETEASHDRSEPYIIRRSRAWRWLFRRGGSRNPVVSRLARFLMVFLVYRLALGVRDADAIVVGHAVPLGRIAVAIKRLRGTRIITITVGEDITIYGAGPRSRRLLISALAESDAITTLTNVTARLIGEMVPGTVPRITVIPPPVDPSIPDIQPEAVGQLRQDHGIHERRLLLTVARIVPRKGVDVTMQALALVANEFPDLVYLVVGTGPDLGRLHDLRKRLGLENRIQFLGAVKDQRPYFHACDIFVMPNRTMPDGEHEGYGIVFSEAGLAEKPVIAGRSGGVVEAVEDGVTGFLVDPENPAAVADAIRALLGDPARARHMGEQGRVRAMSKCLPEAIWASFDQVVQSVVPTEPRS